MSTRNTSPASHLSYPSQSMQQPSDFTGGIQGDTVIAGTTTAAGGTTNFIISNGPSRKRTPFSTVPFAPDPDFVDRPDILAWIHDNCARPGARAALVGLGGVGKSQIAIRYCYDIRDTSPQTSIFWVYASTKARFEEAYRDIADRLELPGRENPKADILRLVRNWLCEETNGQWTMVLDNVDDVETFSSRKGEQDKPSESPPASLAVYLPQSPNGSILITSRNKDAAAGLAGGYKNIKEVQAMDEAQGLQLLRNKLLQDALTDDTIDLLRALDYIPLAITQAAAYINRRARMTISKYLDEFRRNNNKRENLLNWDIDDIRRDDSASNSVVTTWQISFERIRKERPSAADLLSLMSFFNPQGIPESILRRHSRTVSRTVAKPGCEDEANNEFDEDFDTLQAYSLVSATTETDVCEMHALVQFCTRIWLSSFSDAEWWKQQFVQLMARELPNGEFKNWAKCQQLLPHVESLYGAEPVTEKFLKDWAKILTNSAWYMWMTGRYKIAHDIAIKALNAGERANGQDDQLTLISVTVLALVLQSQGKYSEAEKLNRRALEGREKELDHPDTLTSVYCLAYLLHKRRRYREASELYQSASNGYKQKLGSQHPKTIACLNYFTAMQQEAGEERQGPSRTSVDNDKEELREIPTDGASTLHDSEAMPEQTSSLKSKKDSFYTRLKGRMGRKDR
ncbi:hypothetical protein P152DRAFT_507770 [Eremomyces bilateralis CBS 781.70]|uniref:DUF7779 domain-containing protein n=1 Tax=Eremomyces bilateralis CBS 781.70 TaxID=1392243 RepID=A0A6G1G248_9PEZI|nr:uncharacterized protein P152DRAFT_507770 [Eremomyces bilateralis CBS 781.70]KAF1812000.1 hypothetical protein P152DRAFT_507770 [Eremomyces bilateralis CBS 781.70]